MGPYPVIFLSLKSAKQPTYEISCEKLQREIAKEYKRHSYILNDTILFPSEKKNSFLLWKKRHSSLNIPQRYNFIGVPWKIPQTESNHTSWWIWCTTWKRLFSWLLRWNGYIYPFLVWICAQNKWKPQICRYYRLFAHKQREHIYRAE